MKTKGLTLTELLVVIGTTTMVTGSLMPALHRSRQTAVRLVCETNLTGIGKAMVVYAAENVVGDFPVAGGVGANWVASPDRAICQFDAVLESDAFGYDHSIPIRGNATITSSFFLLIKYSKVTPNIFVCKGDVAQVFKLRDQRTRERDIHVLWDFGNGSPMPGGASVPYPGGYCSYSYQMPYSVNADPEDVTNYAVTDRTSPAMPICADRNPYLDSKIDPGDPLWNGNSAAHERKGQNVLYKDGSVTFEKSVTVGIGGDNIYTYGDPGTGGGDPNGTPPASNGDGFPAGEKDAYLVGEHNYR